MSFESIIGQPLAVKLVQRWLAQQTTQPLLFYGPEGVGKKRTALEAAKALNCEFTSPSPLMGGGRDGGVTAIGHPPPRSSPTRGEEVLEGCGTCLSCKKITAGRHPDVRVVDLAYQAVERGEPLEKQQSIKIETVLAERKRLYQTSNEGAWKVSILDDAQRMTPDAANVLLKVLEEPPPRTAIFLLTPYRDRIFSTIVSRCQSIRFRSHPSPPPRQTSGESPVVWRPLSPTRGEGGSKKSPLPNVGEGQGEGGLQAAEALWKELPNMTPGQILAKQPRSRTAVTRADIETELQVLLSPALRELRSRHGDPGGLRQAVAKVELIQKAQQQLRQNVPPALVYDHLLLRLSRITSSPLVGEDRGGG